MTIAITGAAGHLGRLTAQLVLDRVPPGEVVLVTRRPDAIADLADAGATVRRGDFDEPDSLPAAFAGVDRLLLISTDVLGNRVAQHTAAIDAAAAAGVGHVLYTSGLNAGSELPLVVSHEHGATEQAIRDRGLRWTALRNGLYAEFQVAARGARRRLGAARAQQRRRRDRLRLARGLRRRRRGGAHRRRPRGPRLRHHRPRARHAGAARRAGRRRSPAVPSRPSPSTTTQATQNLTAVGLPADAAMAYASFGTAIREGVLDVVSSARAKTSPAARPRSLREVLEAHRSELEETA